LLQLLERLLEGHPQLSRLPDGVSDHEPKKFALFGSRPLNEPLRSSAGEGHLI
jgi:hypothetical protein